MKLWSCHGGGIHAPVLDNVLDNLLMHEKAPTLEPSVSRIEYVFVVKTACKMTTFQELASLVHSNTHQVARHCCDLDLRKDVLPPRLYRLLMK